MNESAIMHKPIGNLSPVCEKTFVLLEVIMKYTCCRGTHIDYARLRRK